MVMLIPLIWVCLFHQTVFSCSNTISENDQYTIAAILEDTLSNDCISLRKLAGVFYSDQERPPRSVRVKYNIQIPYNEDCTDQCMDCWKSHDQCNKTNDCPDGYCCVKADFLWGRTPLLVHDAIYRTLELCPFVVGGLKEKVVELNLYLNRSELLSSEHGLACVNERSFPCNWCHSRSNTPHSYNSENVLDYVVSITDHPSPIQLALTTLTAKLQGYAVKGQKLPWLKYSSEIAVGYAAPYRDLGIEVLQDIRYVSVLLSYFLFNIVIFMLVYKLRHRIYKCAYNYNVDGNQKSAFFWSFLFTIFMSFVAMTYMTWYAGGICISVLEVLLLFEMLMFIIPIFCIVCLHLKLKKDFFPSTSKIICSKSSCASIYTQAFVFAYIFFLPHTALFLLIKFFSNFFQNPLGYIILLMYFILSLVILWIANALFLHLISPSIGMCCPCKNKQDFRRLTFAICLFVAVNLFNFTIWGFVSAYYYDRRGKAGSYLSLLPGVILSLVGWYLSGNLLKFFSFFSFAKHGDENDNQDGYTLMVEEHDNNPKILIKEIIKLIRRPSFPARIEGRNMTV